MCNRWYIVLPYYNCVSPHLHNCTQAKYLLMHSRPYNVTQIVCVDKRFFIMEYISKTGNWLKLQVMPEAASVGCWLCHGPVWESCDNKVRIFCCVKKMYCLHVAATLRMGMHSQSPARLNGRGHQAAVWHIVLMFGGIGTSWAFTPTSTHPLLKHMRPD